MRNTITEDTLTNTFASGDKTTGDAPTARTGLALCHRVTLDSVAHWWVPARTPTVHQCLYGREAVGGPRHSSTRHHQQRQDQGYHATPWLPTWVAEASSLKPQIYEATTELGDKAEEMIVSDRIVNPGYVFVTSEYVWSVRMPSVL